MRRAGFLTKLYREGKLSETEASDEIKKAYLQRSEESLSSAKILMEKGNLKDSVALAYYSMYHCLMAALYRIGIKCENHAAAIIMLKEVFGRENDKISIAKKERVDKQYYVDFEVQKEEAESSVKVAEEFIAGMTDFIANLTEQVIAEYREKAVSLFRPK